MWHMSTRPSRLEHVTITPPRVAGGLWTIRVQYNDGAVTMSYPTEAEAVK